MLEGMTRVRARIAEINARFSPEPPAGREDFAAHLAKAAEEDTRPAAIRHRPADANTGAAGSALIRQMLMEAAQKHGVDGGLVLAVAKAESGFRPDAVSSAGAVGVMQLMPDTARSLGVTDSFNARENIDGGVKYLKQMLNMFGGDAARALAAYNAGPGAVNKYGGIPPYQETQAYVKNILADIAE